MIDYNIPIIKIGTDQYPAGYLDIQKITQLISNNRNTKELFIVTNLRKFK